LKFDQHGVVKVISWPAAKKEKKLGSISRVA